MITVIAEHSVDISLLPPDANILDIGCRGHRFTNELECGNAQTGRKGYCIDIDEEAKPHYLLAISDYHGTCSMVKTADPQGRYIIPGHDIQVMTIDGFSKMVGVTKWDLIKIDVEGEEIKILKSLKHPYCEQISVEFHAHLGQTKQELDTLLDWLGQWYTIHNRVWEDKHCAGFNYWDILLIKK